MPVWALDCARFHETAPKCGAVGVVFHLHVTKTTAPKCGAVGTVVKNLARLLTTDSGSGAVGVAQPITQRPAFADRIDQFRFDQPLDIALDGSFGPIVEQDKNLTWRDVSAGANDRQDLALAVVQPCVDTLTREHIERTTEHGNDERRSGIVEAWRSHILLP